MNLFRSDTIEGVDNYNAFVKPSVDQGRVNRRFGGEITGLQNAARNQGAALQTLGTAGGRGVPHFMNHQGYYPSLRR